MENVKEMEQMVGKRVIVDDEIMTILKVATLGGGYIARLERTKEEFFIADFQIKKVL